VWVKDIVDQGNELVKFITNHHASLAMIRKHSAAGSGKSLKKSGKHCCAPIKLFNLII
jgi:hypothetical protein